MRTPAILAGLLRMTTVYELIQFSSTVIYSPNLQEYKSLSEDIIGSEGELSMDDYTMIYHSTGGGIDGRLHAVQSRVVSYARRLATYLMFMSRIPGFQNIPEIDRDALANGKSASHEHQHNS